jgi:hypothetical protein
LPEINVKAVHVNARGVQITAVNVMYGWKFHRPGRKLDQNELRNVELSENFALHRRQRA